MHRRVGVLAALVLVATIVLASLLRAAGPLDDLDESMWDRLGGAPGIADRWIVVGTTDATGWGRDALARVAPNPDGLDSDRVRTAATVATVDRLLDAGVAIVALTELLEVEDLERGDAERLVRTLASGPVLPPFLDAAPIDLAGGRDATFTTRYRPPLDAVADLPTAHVIVPVGDGPVRSLPLLVEHRAQDRSGQEQAIRFLPVSLAAVLALAEDLDAVGTQRLALDGTRLQVGDVEVPHDDGRLRITWAPRLTTRVPGTTTPSRWRDGVPFVLAEDVVAGRVPAERLAGRIVLLGSIDPLQADYRTVPGGPDGGVPEVWVHANALNTILTDSHRVPVGSAVDVLLLALLGAIGVGLTARLEVGRATLLVAVAGVLLLVVVRAMLAGGRLADPVGPLLALAIGWLGMFAVRYAVEGRQRRRVAALFRSYVPDTVAEQLIEESASLDDLVSGQRVEITVLFCDLRGFTAQAATLEPPDVRDLLNVYYRHMARIILDRDGTIMQYVGDEVFAVFGAPLHQDDHAARALDAALRMQQAARQIADELAGSGIAPIAYGIGVHSGRVVAAHVGDDVRRQYSVVGDTVNVGARLCSQAKAGEVVASQDVVERLPQDHLAAAGLSLDPLLDVQMKGVSRDFGIFRVLGSD